MKKQQKEIEKISDEVNDILAQMPHWMICWGNVIILFIIIIYFFFSYLIKYPEIITASIVITTKNPPERLVSRINGRIEHILVQDKALVSKNSPLAIIKSSANYKDVELLKNTIDSLDLNSGSDIADFPLIKSTSLRLGDIENAYAVFEKDLLTYQINVEFKPYKIDKISQEIEFKEQEERLKLLIDQSNITLTEIKYKKKDLERYKNLFDKGIISAQEYENKNIEFLQHQKIILSLNSQISSLRSSLNNLGKDRKSTILLENRDQLTLRNNLKLSYNQLKKAIRDWEMNYVLKSSMGGRVSFLKVWFEYQNINVGESLFVVIPDEMSDYIGKIKAPAFNSGKIKIGQEVQIRLVNYPDTEFGILKGKIESISLTPDNENNLLIDVQLLKGLKTSYNKEIIFQQEMSGTADIVTHDLRLLERILYQFRGLLSRKL